MEKPTVGEKFRALLATGRAANLPTVWCNVLVAFSLSRLSAHHYNADPGRFWTAALAFLLISASCIYVGGCMLGDARDINFDKEHRPNRPLPRGVLSTTFVTISAWGLLFGGLIIVVISALLSAIIAHGIEWRELVNFLGSKNGLIAIQLHEILLASLLTACVIAYAFIHKRNKIVGLALMASCRFLLVFFAISVAHKTFYGSPASAEPLFLYRSWVTSWMPLLALTVGVYTLLLSWVASTEAKPGQFQFRSILATCMLTLPVVSFILVAIIQQNLKFQTANHWAKPSLDYSQLPPSQVIHWMMLAVFALWILYALRNLKTSKPAFVSNALAGFCLLDACIAATFSTTLPFICLGLFGIALLLQKVTPAT